MKRSNYLTERIFKVWTLIYINFFLYGLYSEYCVMRQAYRNLYYNKLCNSTVDESRLKELEIKLDIPTLVELREWAKLKAKKRPSSSWLGGWFSSSKVETEEDVVDESDRKRLMEVIEDSVNKSATNPPGVIRYTFKISLPLFKLELTNLASFSLRTTELEILSIPGSHSNIINMSFKSLEMSNVKHDRSIMESNPNQDGKFFQFQFQTNPFDADCKRLADQLLTLKSSGITFNYDNEVVRDIAAFFTVPEQFMELKQTVQDEYIQRFEQSRSGLAHIVSTRNIFLIDIDFQAPKIIIPGPDGQLITMNFGRLCVKSNKSKLNSVLDFKQTDYQIDQLQELAYSDYDVQLDNLEITVSRAVVKADQHLSEVEHVLRPLSILLTFHRLDSKAQATADLPKYKFNAKMDELYVKISNYRVAQVLYTMNGIKRKWRQSSPNVSNLSSASELPIGPIIIPNRTDLNEVELGDSLYQIQLAELAQIPIGDRDSEDNLFYDAESDFSLAQTKSFDTQTTHSSSISDSAVQLAVSLNIGAVTVDLLDEVKSEHVVQLRLSEAVVDYQVKKLSNQMIGHCQTILILYRPDLKTDGKMLTVLSSGFEQDAAIQIAYHEVDIGDMIEADMNISAASIPANIDSECFNRLTAFFKMISDVKSRASVFDQIESLSTIGSPLGSEASFISDSNLTESDLTLVKPLVRNIVISAAKFDLNLLSSGSTLVNFVMEGTQFSIVLRNHKTTVKLSVEKIQLQNPNISNPIYQKVISIVDESKTFFDMQIEMFNIDPETQSNDPSVVNGNVYVRTGSIHYVFFYHFMEHLAFVYPDEFGSGSDTESVPGNSENSVLVSPPSQKVLKADESTYASRYSLDIEIDTPTVFIPVNEQSKCGLQAELGVLIIKNRFEAINGTATKYAPMLDQIVINIKELRLYRIMEYVGRAKLDKTQHVEVFNESFDIIIQRNLSSLFYFDEAEMKVKIAIDNIAINFSKQDLEIFWCVLYGNIQNRYTKPELVVDKPSGPTRRTGYMSGNEEDEGPERRTALPSVTIPQANSAHSSRSDDYNVMVVDIIVDALEIKLFTENDHQNELAKLCLKQMLGKYKVQQDDVMSYCMTVNDILVYDLRNISTNMTGCFLQKQFSDLTMLDAPVFELAYHGYPQPKQIISLKMRSMRMIFVLDFIQQLQDILYGSMLTEDVINTQPQTQGAYNLTEAGNSHLQFQLEMDRPHILILTDLKNSNTSSVMKLGADIRINYIASMLEQNLDIAVLDTRVYCVPFKFSFGDDETTYGQHVMNHINIDFHLMTSHAATIASLKFNELDLVLTPAVVNTLYMSYTVCFGDESDKNIDEEEQYIPLDCQQQVEPAKLWFIPNPTGSDVDSTLSGELASLEASERPEESMTIDLPSFSIKLESNIFYGSTTRAQSIPLLVATFEIKSEIRDWSSDLECLTDIFLTADVYHETRPGFESFIEQVETNADKPDSSNTRFHVRSNFKQYPTQSKRCFTDEFTDDDDFEHVDRLPKQQLTIEAKIPLHLNLSSESIHVINHLSTAFNNGLEDARRGNSSQQMLQASKSTLSTEIKAPITVHNETGQDIALTACSTWVEVAYTCSKSTLSPTASIVNRNYSPASSPAPSPVQSHTLHPNRAATQRTGSPTSSSRSISSSTSSSKTIHNLGSLPIYFQYPADKSPDIYKQESQIIGISPAGFTMRHVDVSSLQENAYQFRSNTDKELTVVLTVNVEGIAGLRRITIRSSVFIQNNLPFPLEIIHPTNPSMKFIVSDEDTISMSSEIRSLPLNLFSSRGTLAIRLADPQVDRSAQELDYTTEQTSPLRVAFSVRDQRNTIVNKYYVVVAFNRHTFVKSQLSKVTLIVSPSFSVRNWLPFPIQVQLEGHRQISVDAGRVLPILDSNTNPTVVISFGVRTPHDIQYQSEKYKIPKSPGNVDKEDISYWKFSRRQVQSNEKLGDSFLKRKMMWTRGQVQIQIFSPYWIMNGTGLLLEYRTLGGLGQDEDTTIHLDTDPYVILPTKRDEITISCMKSARSEKIPINTVGHLGTLFCPPSSGDHQSYLLGLAVTASSFGLTSIVNITPFYFIINRTEFALEVAETFKDASRSNTPFWTEVKPNSKHPFWPQEARDSYLIVRRARTSFVSQPIDYGNQDQGILLHTGDVTGIFAEITHNDNECLISFAPYFSGSAAFNLINLTGFEINYRQLAKDKLESLSSCHSVLYTWSHPVALRELEVVIDDPTNNLQSNNSPHLNVQKKSSSISRMGSKASSIMSWNKMSNSCKLFEGGDDAMKVREINISGATVYVIPIFIGTQRTVIFTQDEWQKKRLLSSEKQITNFDIQLKIKSIIMSIIDSVRRREVSLLSLTGTGALWHIQRTNQKKWREAPDELQRQIEHRYRLKQTTQFRYDNYAIDINRMEMTSGSKTWKLNRSERPGLDIRYQLKENSTTLDFKVQNIQIDNNLHAHHWPVVFARVPPKQTVAAVDVDDNISMVFVQITWGSSEERNITKFRNFHVLLQECFLNLDIDYIYQVVSIFYSSKGSRSVESETYRMFQEDVLMIRNLTDDSEDLKRTTISFFEKIHFSPVKLNFKYTLEMVNESTMDNDALELLHWIQDLGIGIVTKGEVDFKLNYFNRNYEFFSDSDIMNKIMAHYRFQIIQQTYKFLFGVDIFGNPAKVAVDMVSGVKDFFYEPYQGLTQSGDEFIEGIRSGTGKMVSGILGGTTGGLSKMTHTLGSVSAQLTFDKQYQDKRNHDSVNAVRGVKEGFSRAGEKLFGGFAGGLMGIVTKPIEGAKTEGAGGFFKGVGRGLGGLLAKPVTGIVDATSTAFAGVQTQLDVKEHVRRIRYPRVVDEAPLESYKYRLAYAQELLWSLDEDFLPNTEEITDLGNQTPLGMGYTNRERFIIIVTAKTICLIDKRTTTGRLKAEWIRNIQQVRSKTDKIPHTHYMHIHFASTRNHLSLVNPLNLHIKKIFYKIYNRLYIDCQGLSYSFGVKLQLPVG